MCYTHLASTRFEHSVLQYIYIYIYIYIHGNICFLSPHNQDRSAHCFQWLHIVYNDFILITFPGGRGIWKIKKREWKHGAETGLLKGEGGWHFSYLIFSRFIIFPFRNYFTLFKIILCIWRKNLFSPFIILWKKFILSCVKMNVKISHKLRQPICKKI